MIDNIVTVLNSKPLETNTGFYNNQKYQIDIVFDNLQGNTFSLNLASMVSLEIEEDSRQWFKKATLTIKNPNNVFEQKISSSDTPNQYYKFRNDGRDLVYIVVKPINDDTLSQSNLQLDYDVWGMAYTFCIYDRKEMLNGESSLQKELKLYLWEFDYQIFTETNVSWSTVEMLPTSIIPAQATDEQKLVPTGNAIKSLITKILSQYSTPTFSKDWDPGASKIFFTSFANGSAEDTLDYLFKKFVSAKTNDPGLLSRTRYTKKWQLRSYASIFDDALDKQSKTAGKLQREIFTISSQGGERSNEYVFNATESTVPGYSIKYQNTNYSDPSRSLIKKFSITDMAAIDSAYEMVTSPCYSNNLKDKTFQVDFKNNTIENVKKYIDETYTKKLQMYTPPSTLVTLNKPKLEARSLNTIYSYSPDKVSRLAESRNMLLAAALFFNTSINFTALGSPVREIGTFISIKNTTGGLINEFINKLTGQWLVYKVVHRFSGAEYTNDVTAVRLHANASLGVKDNIV